MAAFIIITPVNHENPDMPPDYQSPIRTSVQTVKPEWCDYNGHMNVAYYTLAFETAGFEAQEILDLGERYVTEEQRSLFTTKGSYTYLQELTLDSPLYVDYLIIDYAPKLFHLLMLMYHAEEGFMAAYTEQILMHVDLVQRRVIPFSDDKLEMIGNYCRGHASLERPKGLGEAVGIRKRG